jgi:hypothetical protein
MIHLAHIHGIELHSCLAPGSGDLAVALLAIVVNLYSNVYHVGPLV